jgi:hypothetical protein
LKIQKKNIFVGFKRWVCHGAIYWDKNNGIYHFAAVCMNPIRFPGAKWNGGNCFTNKKRRIARI